MTYAEAIAFLGQSRFFGMKPGLDRMRRIAERLGSPQKGLRFIHLAGTNGKGSTAAFTESCLRALGFRVGLYTSPHLISVRERIQIDRIPLSENDFAEGLSRVRASLEGEDEEATFFELTTALALLHFAKEKVDWVVWETGLGGRLDATNIVEPELCLITSIGLDHQQYLGSTLREIAVEKAGIIKPGVPVISAPQREEAGTILREAAQLQKAPFFEIGSVENLGLQNQLQLARIENKEWLLGLIGSHQIQNAACAIAAIRHLFPSGPVDDQVLSRGLKNTAWPGRFQILSRDPLTVLDGAHNPAGAAMLAQTWRDFLALQMDLSTLETNSRAHLVFATVADKAIAEIAQFLRPLAKRVSLVRLASERTADPAQLASHFPSLPCQIYSSVAEFGKQMSSNSSGDPVLITGSLFLVGEWLAYREGRVEEYQLNERLESSAIAG